MHHKLFTLFSTRPPVHLFVPKTKQAVVIFPTIVEVAGKKYKVVQGFVERFKVFLDLQNSFIEVKGVADNKSFHYKIYAEKNAIYLKGIKQVQSKKLLSSSTMDAISLEIIHFGEHKKLDLSRFFERKELREFLPIWFRLSQLFPRVKEKKLPLMEKLEHLKKTKKHDQIGAELMQLFSFLFPNRLCPAAEDLLHTGFLSKGLKGNEEFLLLQKSGEYIRSLFIAESAKGVEILPHLIPEIAFGKVCDIQSKFGTIELRISKKKPFSLEFRPCASKMIYLAFPKQIKSARLRNHKKQRGARVTLPLKMKFEKDEIYLLDRFEK